MTSPFDNPTSVTSIVSALSSEKQSYKREEPDAMKLRNQRIFLESIGYEFDVTPSGYSVKFKDSKIAYTRQRPVNAMSSYYYKAQIKNLQSAVIAAFSHRKRNKK